MHASAEKNYRNFLKKYIVPGHEMVKILDIGSYDINGTLKPSSLEHIPAVEYVGLDMSAGPNVDVVSNSNNLPFNDNSFDLCISSSAFEHDEKFWLTFNEMVRVAKEGALIYVCAPSAGHYHGVPKDCWRFYEDSWGALADWSGVDLLESFVEKNGTDEWNDSVGIFRKRHSSREKVAIITANIGGIDGIYKMPQQTSKYDYFYYDENNLPFPLPNLENRLKSKYLKIQTHHFLPQYDMYIWIDGSIEILSENFVGFLKDSLSNHDITICKHPVRDNVYDELDCIIDAIKKGDNYLSSRYADQQLEKEVEFFKSQNFPKSFPLFACYAFARKNNHKVNKCFDEWWRKCTEFSNFDQAMFSYAARKSVLSINALDPKTDLFKRNAHQTQL